MDTLRKIVFTQGGTELVLPVTPPAFQVGFGIRIETVNIHGMGDLRIAGHPTLGNFSVDLLLPANAYGWAVTRSTDPYGIIAQFKKWARVQAVLRLIITGTDVNIPVQLESCDYGEQDGSNDVVGTLHLSEYRYVGSSAGAITALGISRAVDTRPVIPQTYTVKQGDCLRTIAEQFYGNANHYSRIAAINNIGNAHVLRVGMVLRLPGVS